MISSALHLRVLLRLPLAAGLAAAFFGELVDVFLGGRPLPLGLPSAPSTFGFSTLAGPPSVLGRPRGRPVEAFGAALALEAPPAGRPRFLGAGLSSAVSSSSRPRFFGFLMLPLVFGASAASASSSPSSTAAAPFLAEAAFFGVVFDLGVLVLFLVAFSSTSTSDCFFTTSLPDRVISSAGSSGSAGLVIVLPRFDVTAASPSVFLSATSPDGPEPPQFQETARDVSHLYAGTYACIILYIGRQQEVQCET